MVYDFKGWKEQYGVNTAGSIFGESPDDTALETDEIEVTPEMIDAGVAALYDCLGDRLPNVFPYGRDCVDQIYRAIREKAENHRTDGTSAKKRRPASNS